ncbi:MAG: hypothetical protein ACRD72_24430, partial [Candidatus Angelobacter sp.]
VVGGASSSKASQFVPVVGWSANGTAWNSTLSGIAKHFGLTLSALLALPGNAQYRSNPSLVHVNDQVQVN